MVFVLAICETVLLLASSVPPLMAEAYVSFLMGESGEKLDGKNWVLLCWAGSCSVGQGLAQ